MFILKVFPFFLVCLLIACGSSASQTGLSLKMKRFGCYGSCPNYDLTVQPDGKVTIEKVIIDGGFWKKSVNKTADKLNDEQLKQLVSEIEKVNFFSFDDAYNDDSTDCQNSVKQKAGVILHIQLSGKKKTINHYFGCRFSEKLKGNNPANIKIEKDCLPEIFPQELYDLENKIDEIVEIKSWLEKENGRDERKQN